jgi:hypothetical protein
MDFAQAANADGFAEVDVSSYGGSADVEPIFHFEHASQFFLETNFGMPIDFIEEEV